MYGYGTINLPQVILFIFSQPKAGLYLTYTICCFIYLFRHLANPDPPWSKFRVTLLLIYPRSRYFMQHCYLL